MQKEKMNPQTQTERRMPWWLVLIVISLALWAIAYLVLLVV